MTTHPSHFPADDLSAARELDHRLVAARRAERGASHQLAVLLTDMAAGGFRTLGYASIHQYASSVLELPARQARDLIRIGRAIPTLPMLGSAMADGLLDWTKAREIIRIATPDTEQGWVERAQTMSARVIEQEIACSVRGDPAPVGAPMTEKEPRRRRVYFEMETSDAEVLYQALALLRMQSDLDPSEIEDGALLAAMARRAVQMEESNVGIDGEWTDDAGGVADAGEVTHGAVDSAREGADTREPTQPTGSLSGTADPRGSRRSAERYRIVVQRCPNCRHMDAPDADISDTIAAESCCDAEIIDMPRRASTRAWVPARSIPHRRSQLCRLASSPTDARSAFIRARDPRDPPGAAPARLSPSGLDL